MAGSFDYFVVFAEMRTGSNFLEANLNAFNGITCLGEAFNPHFIGYPNRKDILGVSQRERDANPETLIERIRGSEGLNGFRFFHDHDPRVLEICLNDPRCAKIILTRNPLESYVSLKIAQATGQWKLTDVKRRKEAKAEFDADEFATHLALLKAFQVNVLNRLQTGGQTAFYVAYEDLQSVDVMNGLAAFLGIDARLESLDKSLKRQNPSSLSDKVSNFKAMERDLAGLDWFDLGRTPNFEPRRAAAVPSYVAGALAPILFLPLRGGPEQNIVEWLASLDNVPVQELSTGMNQKELRQWKRRNVGHRSFTVIRHPVERAHSVFCERILGTGAGSFGKIRETLNKQFDLNLPDNPGSESYDRAAHQTAFRGFLEFLKLNLAGQTAIRVDPHWCSQSQLMQGFGEMALPDLVIREEEMMSELTRLAEKFGYDSMGPIATPKTTPYALKDIYDAEIEALAKSIYQRDYMMFGFGTWSDTCQAA